MMKNTNISVTVDSKNFEFKGNLKLSLKGLHVVSNGDHKATEQSKSMPAYSELHVGSLNADIHFEGGMKGLLDFTATVNDIKKGDLSVGSKENPFFGKDDIHAAIDCSDVHLKESGVRAHHTFHENGKVWHENIDTYNNELSLDEFGIEGTLSDIGDVFMQIMGSIGNNTAE